MDIFQTNYKPKFIYHYSGLHNRKQTESHFSGSQNGTFLICITSVCKVVGVQEWINRSESEW